MNMKFVAPILLAMVSVTSAAAQPNLPCPTLDEASVSCSSEEFSVFSSISKVSDIDEPGFFTNGFGIVTLTNDFNDLPDSCVFKGRATANRNTEDPAPIDSITRMNWYIETSRKHRANYLLGNVRYESLWSYQCSDTG